MNAHSPEHEAILSQVLLGDLAEDDAKARAVLESCSICREQLAAFRDVETRAQAAGEFQRLVLEESEKIVDAPGLDQVEAVLGELEDRPNAAPANRVRPLPWVVWPLSAAAAAIVVLWVSGFLTTEPTTEPSHEILLGVPIQGMEPQGQVGEYGTFRWRHSLPTGGWFVVRVFDAEAPAGTAALQQSKKLFDFQWQPARESEQTWPDSIRWTVQAYSATGQLSATGESRATRDP